MRRICIIDHSNHSLIVEDVSEEALAKYKGDEQAYIDDNYSIGDNYSWDWIVSAEYYPVDAENPMEIDFSEL